MKNYLGPILLCLVITFSVDSLITAQETVIYGKITDAKTNESIPFANIYFKGTTIGTSSNFEGEFSLTTRDAGDSLTVSCLGYFDFSRAVIKGRKQKIDFQLQPTAISIPEVFVVPGENPAHRIIREAAKRKKDYNLEKLDAFQKVTYSRTEIGIKNISNKFKNRPSMKPFKPLFDSLMIAAGENGSLILPILFSETSSEVFFHKNPERKKEIILASKVNGVGLEHTHEFVSQVVGTSFHDYNFNNNFIKILDKNVMSPIANGGLGFYKYYLTDSLVIDDHFCYEIQVMPKRKNDVVFTGIIWIQDTTYALKRIVVNIDKKADLNFIENFRVQQDLIPVEGNIWVPQKTRVLIDFSQVSDSTFGMLARFYLSDTNYVINQPRDLKFYNVKLEFKYDANDHNNAYWQMIRPEKLTATEQSIYSSIDSINNFPRVRTYVDIIETLVNGYYRIKGLEFGPYLLVYGYNSVEGSRFRLGFRANAEFSKKWVFKAYAAYGTKDRKFKYSATVERFLSRKNWTKVGFMYKNDVEGLGVIDGFYQVNNMFALTTQLGLIDKMREIKRYRLWFESDLFRGFNQKIVLSSDYFSPLGNYVFEYFTDDAKTTRSSEIQSTELILVSRYAPKETVLISNNTRIGVGTQKAPLITFRYTLGIKGAIGSDFNYHKLSLKVSQKVKFFELGRFRYEIQGEKVFHQLPYPLLQVQPGNETFIYSKKSYNLMNFLEFVTDQNVSLRFVYNFEGALLGKIPLIRSLKWRAVASTNIVYGSLDMKNRFYDPETNPTGILPKTTLDGVPLTTYRTFENGKPYVEVSYGVENIFRIIRIQVFHRLTYRFENSPKWGIKGSLFFMF
jgi:hypothetical protein